MNEPTPPDETSQPPATDGVEPAGVSDFGAALRAAREAAGLSVPALAGRLRLHIRQIEALERSDLAALPTLIYVRGFVRSCARELKIDVAPLLEDLDRRAGVVPGAPLVPAGAGFRMARLGDGSRSVVTLAIVALVIAGIVGTLWPRRPSVAPKPAVAEVPAPAVALPDPAPAPAAPDPATAPPAVVSPVAVSPAAASPPAVTAAPAAAPASANRAPAPTGAAPRAPQAPAAASAGPVTNRPLIKALPVRPGDGAAAAAAPAPAPLPAALPAPAPEPAPAPAAAADGSALVLHVHASSWVEVVQANGTSVFSQICPAGSVQTVHAEGPLRIVIGNAGAVEAQYRGVPVDLNRYANANGVARFTLQ